MVKVFCTLCFGFRNDLSSMDTMQMAQGLGFLGHHLGLDWLCIAESRLATPLISLQPPGLTSTPWTPCKCPRARGPASSGT